MPPNYRTKPGAIFDVKPVDETGSVDVEKITAVEYTVNLASFRPKKAKQGSAVTRAFGKPEAPIEKSYAPVPTPAEPEDSRATGLPPVISLPSQENIKEQFQELLNHDLDLGVELAKFHPALAPEARPARARGAVRYDPALDLYAPVLTEIHRSAKAVTREESAQSLAPVPE